MSGGGYKALFILPLAVFAALIAAFLSQIDKDPSILPSARIDMPVPNFELPSLNGSPKTQYVFSGPEPTLMNVFASWCQPCWAEHGAVTRLADSGVPIIGWAYKDKPDAIARYLARLGNPYRDVVLDAPGRTAIEFGVYGAPETYVIDCKGIIRHRFVGALNDTIVAEQIRPVLAEVATAPESGCAAPSGTS